MSQPSRKEEQFQLFHEINRVEGFDPAAFAVEYTDMNTGEVRKRLPVMIQMAWFRLKYPEGRIAVEVTPAKDCFVAKASATWRRPPPPVGRTQPIPRFLPGSGRRRLPWALPCETQASACSSALPVRKSLKKPPRNWAPLPKTVPLRLWKKTMR